MTNLFTKFTGSSSPTKYFKGTLLPLNLGSMYNNTDNKHIWVSQKSHFPQKIFLRIEEHFGTLISK